MTTSPLLRFTTVAATLCALSPCPAFALAPDQVFEKVSPSVWAVRGLDALERPFSYGSGVVVAPGRVITNCHVLARAKAIQVRRENISFEGRLEHADVERDLCLLSVAGFTAPPVEIGTMDNLKVGQRAYAIGNPQRFALTLSEGLISGLRGEDPRVPPIQTTAPISPGSSGGGLFDVEGRLVGITTLIFVGRERLAQSINFALPADWIKDVPERSAMALAKRKDQAAARASAASGGGPSVPASDSLPEVGATWKYRYSDLHYGRIKQDFTLRVTGVSGWSVTEAFERGNAGDGAHAIQATIVAQDLKYGQKLIESGRTIAEFAPYLIGTGKLEGSLPWHELGSTHPLAKGAGWRYDGMRQAGEQVSVPAGSYKSVRVEINGRTSSAESASVFRQYVRPVARFQYTIWYAPAVKRYVKLRQESWDSDGNKVSDDVVELVSYKDKGS